MVVYHKDAGWEAWCHRCHDRGWVPRPTESLSERLARIEARRAVESAAQDSIVPPMPAVMDIKAWPLPARVWLYKAGLSNKDIEDLAIYYHAETDRVVLPFINDGTLVYWQARDANWTRASKRPKYLNPRKHEAMAGVWFGEGNVVILHEDYLSAYRVHKAGFHTCCLLGTTLTTAVLARLTKYDEVWTWLDNDKGRGLLGNPGQRAAGQALSQLRACGIKVRNIKSDNDPKSYSAREINNILRSGNE